MSWVITKKFIYIVTIAILFCSVVIYLWSGRPVEIVDVHYYSGKDINILARHFPITDRGKLNWWRENERKILEKYNLPGNDFRYIYGILVTVIKNYRPMMPRMNFIVFLI